MAETTMQTSRGELVITRPHTGPSSPLRAWSAADTLVINELASISDGAALAPMLIVNDEFGALSCAFADQQPTVWSDSISSRAAINHNLAINGFATLPDHRLVPGDISPQGTFGTIVVRIPKTLALLDYQLAVIAALSTHDTRVIGAGMVRHIHSSTVRSFESLVGPTTTSRAQRKARLIHSSPSGGTSTAPPAQETIFETPSGVRVVELPGTFSAGHLDVGSALLVQTLSEQRPPPSGAIVADLGCGNGVLAAEVASRWPTARFQLFDVSDLAIAAADRTWHANNLGDRMTTFVADGFATTPAASVDIVVTNPPFHQGHATDNDLTDRLLADAARVLRPDGVAYVVAQRHLTMHTRLKKWFGLVEVVSGHPSHVVLVASQPRVGG